jgi:glutamate carboxypeptidase
MKNAAASAADRLAESKGDSVDPTALLAFCRQDLEFMLGCLREAVEIESPSGSAHAVGRMADFCARQCGRLGAKVRTYSHAQAGSAVLAEFWDSGGRSKPILLLGHTDTVWELGTLARMPFSLRRGRAYGPGVLDMKSGIVCALEAIRALRALRIRPHSAVHFFLNSDEEIGSQAFLPYIRQEARRARACLVLEPAADGGALKTARKGIGMFRITVHGRSAHAGINPEAGVNAITELARQLVRVEEFSRAGRGITLSVGLIDGGTRINVVPERASACIDVRIPRASDAKVVERRICGLKPFHPGARLEVSGGINRPPMERRASRDLFRRAKRLGLLLGMRLEEAATGGGSDGNFTAALGVPTLDGLGGVGDGAHARHEHILISELPRRAALLAALLATL